MSSTTLVLIVKKKTCKLNSIKALKSGVNLNQNNNNMWVWQVT